MASTETKPGLAETDLGAEESVLMRIGELRVVRPGPTLTFQGLGSCLALVIRDSSTGLVGGAHVLLPGQAKTASGLPGKFVQSAVRALLAELVLQGANVVSLRAKLAGGASMFSSGTEDRPGVGQRNVESARGVLAQAGIPIEAEDVGGSEGRSVRVDTHTGALQVKTLNDSERVL